MNEIDFKKWLYVYLVVSRRSQPTTELQYKLFFELFAMQFEDNSEQAREAHQKEFDEWLGKCVAYFREYLPTEITSEIVDWKGFSVGRVDKEIWEKIKKFYEDTYHEKFEIKGAGTR